MSYINLKGSSLYFEKYGEGLPIVFVHSHGLTHTMFQPQIEYFSQQFEVIVCDLRGNGDSGKLNEPHQHIIQAQSDDLIILLNQLHVLKAIFVGVDYGGMVVQHLALEYPERVQGIVIADSYSVESSSSIVKAFQYAAAYSSIAYYLAPSEWALPSIRLSYQKWQLAYNIIRKSMLMKRPIELYKQRLAALHYHNASRQQEIACPSFFVVGDADGHCMEYTKAVSLRLAHCSFKVIENCMHPSNLCQPDLFNQALHGFINAIMYSNKQAGG